MTASVSDREELRRPGDGGDELDADPDERRRPEEEKHRKRGGEAGGECGERVQEDAPYENPPPPE
jgi:hypothetical protein